MEDFDRLEVVLSEYATAYITTLPGCVRIRTCDIDGEDTVFLASDEMRALVEAWIKATTGDVK